MKLIEVLQECVLHLEMTPNEFSPLFHQAIVALNEHTQNHIAALESQILFLQKEEHRRMEDRVDPTNKVLIRKSSSDGLGQGFESTINQDDNNEGEDEDQHEHQRPVSPPFSPSSTSSTSTFTPPTSPKQPTVNGTTVSAASTASQDDDKITVDKEPSKTSPPKTKETSSSTKTSTSLSSPSPAPAPAPTTTQPKQPMVSAKAAGAADRRSDEDKNSTGEISPMPKVSSPKAAANSSTPTTTKPKSRPVDVVGTPKQSQPQPSAAPKAPVPAHTASKKPKPVPSSAADPKKNHANPTQTMSHEDKLLELERVKKAKMEKQRQEVIAQRRRAAELQKKKQQEEKRKFLEYEQRKQQFKKQGAGHKHDDKDNGDPSLQSRMKDEMSAAFENKKGQEKTKAESKASSPAGGRNVPQNQHQQKKQAHPSSPLSSTPTAATSYGGTPKGSNNTQQPRTFPTPQQQSGMPNSNKTPPPYGYQTQTQQPQVHRNNNNTAATSTGSPPSWQTPRQQQHQQGGSGGIPGPSPTTPSMTMPHLPKQAPQPQRPKPTRPQQSQPQQPPPKGTTASHHHPPTGSDKKYSTMSSAASSSSSPSREEEDELATTSALKRNILLHWALQPPQYNILKPIPMLLCTVQTVFVTPSYGLSSHKYFVDGWKPIATTELFSENGDGSWDADKIKKVVRKLRFFLHPDKLPKDLSETQLFCCKLLWDVTNDAYADYKTSLETLYWIN